MRKGGVNYKTKILWNIEFRCLFIRMIEEEEI